MVVVMSMYDAEYTHAVSCRYLNLSTDPFDVIQLSDSGQSVQAL